MIKLALMCEPFGTIRNLQEREDLELITSDEGIKQIKEHLGNPQWFDFDACFVKIEEGEYKEIYCYYGKIPDLDKVVYKVGGD